MMDITCIVVYKMLLKMFNKYNPVVTGVLESICITEGWRVGVVIKTNIYI